VLLAIPSDGVLSGDRPAKSSFVHGRKDSIVDGQAALAMVSWSEGDFVYVCLIPSGPAETTLQDALRVEFT
jgi:hypothetical protein